MDDILKTVAARIAKEAEPIRARVEKIRAALIEYEAVATAHVSADLLRRLVAEAPEAKPAYAQALALRQLAESLPELRASVVVQAVETPAPRILREISNPAEAAARALLQEFEAHDFDDPAMSNAVFGTYAAEFAARARMLQDRSGSTVATSTIIRRLTAIVHGRRLPQKVFGLALHHRADWERLAQRARVERESLVARTSLPEAAVSKREPVHVPEKEDDEVFLPALRAVGGVIPIVGGVPDPRKLERLRQRTSLDLEWIGADDVESTTVRVKGGRVRFVVLLDGLVRHLNTVPLIEAARQRGANVAYAGRGGLSSIVEALRTLEARVASETSQAA